MIGRIDSVFGLIEHHLGREHLDAIGDEDVVDLPGMIMAVRIFSRHLVLVEIRQ